MRNAEYWKKRSEEIEAQLHKKSEGYYKEAEKQFRMAEKKITDDIEKWYVRLAENNDISLAEARKFLDKDDLEEFKWTVEEYIKHGKENGVSSDWSKQLENASSKYHIRRLEAIQTQIQQHIELIYAGLESGLAQHLAEVYEDAYYRRIFSIQQGFEVGSTVTKLDNRRINKALEHCWAMDGKTFSDRIWQNKTALTNELNTILTQSIIRGENPGDYITALAKKMNTSRKNASRLIYTESAFIASQADQDCYKELGIEEFEFVATLDSHTSEICREMDGQHFPMSEYEIGINAPPLHPNCRSTTVPYFNDEFTNGEQRAARDENGDTYYVPADMTYEEWKEKYVENPSESGKVKLGVGSKSANGNTTRIELGTIDIENTNYLISDFSSKIRNYDIENAIVIDRNGKVIQFVGSSSDAVELFDVDLEGATILHNHPESNGIVSFGEDDFLFLREHQNIKSFHCCNAKYDYCVKVIKDMSDVTYNSIYVEAMQSYTIGEDMQHLAFEALKKKGYVKYERKGKS